MLLAKIEKLVNAKMIGNVQIINTITLFNDYSSLRYKYLKDYLLMIILIYYSGH